MQVGLGLFVSNPPSEVRMTKDHRVRQCHHGLAGVTIGGQWNEQLDGVERGSTLGLMSEGYA